MHQASKEDFVKLVANQLDEEHERGQFDNLVLIAPPGALTELKQNLSNQMAKLVVSDLQKDLTKVPDHDLTEHLASLRERAGEVATCACWLGSRRVQP